MSSIERPFWLVPLSRAPHDGPVAEALDRMERVRRDEGATLTSSEAARLASAASGEARTELLRNLKKVVPFPDQRTAAARATARSLEEADAAEALWTPALDVAAAFPYRLYLARKPGADEPEPVTELRARLARLGRWAADVGESDDLFPVLGFHSPAVYLTLVDHLSAWPDAFVDTFTRQALRRVQPHRAATDVLRHLVNTHPELSRNALLTILSDVELDQELSVALARHPQADGLVAFALADAPDILSFGVDGWRRLLASPSFQACARARQTLIDPLSSSALIGLLESVRQQHFTLPLGELLRPAVERCPGRLLQYFQSVTWPPGGDVNGDDLVPLLGADDVALRDIGLRLAEAIGSKTRTSPAPKPVTR